MKPIIYDYTPFAGIVPSPHLCPGNNFLVFFKFITVSYYNALLCKAATLIPVQLLYSAAWSVHGNI